MVGSSIGKHCIIGIQSPSARATRVDYREDGERGAAVKRTISLGRTPLFTAEKDVTVSMLELELPNDPAMSTMNVANNQIEIRLYRNSYTDDELLRTFELRRGRPVSVLLGLQLSPGETILGSGSAGATVIVEVETKETPK